MYKKTISHFERTPFFQIVKVNKCHFYIVGTQFKNVRKLLKKEDFMFDSSFHSSPPWVNFTNILRAAFTFADPESAKKLLDLIVFFCAIGVCRRKSCS